MQSGYIYLLRKLTENPIWTCEPFSRGQAWVDLIMLANFERNFFYIRNIKVTVERGQLAWSEPKLAERWKWSRTKLRKFLNDLEKEQQIRQQKSNVIQVITILNYDKHQQKKTATQTTEEQQQDTYKERQKKDKEDIGLFPIEKTENDFEKFWNLYGKKCDRAKCEQKWAKLTKADREAITKALPAYLDATPDTTYRKNPLTYLNGRCWEDDVLNPKKHNVKSLDLLYPTIN